MQLDLVHIWASMGTLSRLVAYSLLVMALASIAVTVERLIALARGNAETRAFLAEARQHLDLWSPEGLEAAAAARPQSPLARIAKGMARAYLRAVDDDGGVPVLELVRRERDRQREAASADLRRGMSVLASVGSISPFVGLLGTVIGIITAFQSIATSGSGGLGAVSAGISEALIETALGLMVAIPSVLLFNYLSGRVSGFELALDRGAGELFDAMENEHGRHRSHERFTQAEAA